MHFGQGNALAFSEIVLLASKPEINKNVLETYNLKV